jgi:hypothetical protein
MDPFYTPAKTSLGYRSLRCVQSPPPPPPPPPPADLLKNNVIVESYSLVTLKILTFLT